MEMTIDIVSDPVCPWCYIGKRRLDQALAQRPDVHARVRWLPFQLSPDLPREGRDRREHYAGIFGAERAQAITEKMGETAAAEGLCFQLKEGARSPNTLSAHVLMYWAAHTPGVDAHALAEQLFAAHHSACEDLGDPAVLARLAGEAGMDADQVLARLRAHEDEDAVRDLVEQARAAGVTGVPFFIFNGRHALSGAQPPDVLLQVIDELAAGTAG